METAERQPEKVNLAHRMVQKSQRLDEIIVEYDLVKVPRHDAVDGTRRVQRANGGLCD